MDIHYWAAMALPLIAGWVWKVEQRLMRLSEIESDVKETKSDVKDIYKHLIGERPTRQSGRTSEGLESRE